jgi:hypothetical protein
MATAEHLHQAALRRAWRQYRYRDGSGVACLSRDWDESMKRPRRKKPLPGKRGAKVDSIPFHREISAMQIPYDQMSSALDWEDLGRTRSAACHVVLAWLDMEAAFIRFIERTPAGLVRAGISRSAGTIDIDRNELPGKRAVSACFGRGA